MIKSIYNFYINKTTPPDPEYLWPTSFNNAYTLNGFFNQSNIQASNGQEVYKLKDVIGNIDAPYTGRTAPLLSLARPRFYNNQGGILFFPNETDLTYLSSTLSGARDQLKERWLIGIIANYQIYEAFFNSFDINYLGDRAQEGIRTRNSGDNSGDNKWLALTPIPLNNTFLIRQVYKGINSENPSRVDVDLYLNGVLIGSNMTTLKDAVSFKLGVGADTNNSHWGLKGLYYKNGHFTAGEAAALTTELMTLHKVGQGIFSPYAKDLYISRSGTTYTANWTPQTYNGIAIDSSQTTIDWVEPNGITNGRRCPELNNMKSFNATTVPQYNFSNGTNIRVEVGLVDVQGNRFVIPQSKLYV